MGLMAKTGILLRWMSLLLLSAIAIGISIASSAKDADDPHISGEGSPELEKQLEFATEQSSLWHDQNKQTFDEVFELYLTAERRGIELRKELGLTEFRRQVEGNEIFFEEKGLGQVEFTTINDKSVIRLVHTKTETSYLFLDEDRVPKGSKHLEQWIARQNIHAGTSRLDGMRGRDVIVVWTKAHKFSNVDSHVRPSQGGGRWWSQYWKAIKKKPSAMHWKFGVTCGLIQVAAASCISGVAYWTGASESFNYAPLVLNAVFGTGIGVGVSTYKNWIQISKNRKRQVLKSSVVSIAFAALLMASTKGGELASSGFLTAAGITALLHIASNVYANNWAKTEFMQWVFVKERARVDQGDYLLRIPGTQVIIATPFKTTDVYMQIHSYVPLNMTRLSDLMGVPLAMPLLWSSIPLVQYKTLVWAEKNQPKEALEMRLREKWENGFGRFFKFFHKPGEASLEESVRFQALIEHYIKDRAALKLYKAQQNALPMGAITHHESLSRKAYKVWNNAIEQGKEAVRPITSGCASLFSSISKK